MPPAPRRLTDLVRADVIRTALIALAVLAMAHSCWRFRDFTVDDAGISFAYARNLAHGHGLVHTPTSERVEGYTNFAWVVLLALLQRLGVDCLLGAKLWAALLGALLIVGVAEVSAVLRGRRSRWDAAPALLAALVVPIPYWTMSGLENPLYMAAVLWCLARLGHEIDVPDAWPASALLAALAALTRPDGLLILGGAVVARLLWGGRGRLRYVALAVLPVAAHVVWRHQYYAYWLPNTFYTKVKAPPTLQTFLDLDSSGWRYVQDVWTANRLLPLVWLAPLAFVRRRWRAALCVLGFATALLVFPLYAGGDWMSEGRFVVGLLPLLCVLGCAGVEPLSGLVGRVAKRPRVSSVLHGAGLAAVGAVIVPAAIAHAQTRQGHYPVPMLSVAVRAGWYRDLATTQRLRNASALDGDIGGTSYFSGIRIYDLGALADVTLSRWEWHHSYKREYVLGERLPTLMRLADFWRDARLQDEPEFIERYVALRPGDGIYLDRRAFVVDGVDTRAPLLSLGEDLDLLGAQVQSDEVRVWLLVRSDGVRPSLMVRGTTAQPLAAPLPVTFRSGEIVELAAARGPGQSGALQLCRDVRCLPLSDGLNGKAPVTWAAPRSVDALVADGQRAEAAQQIDQAWTLYQQAIVRDPKRSHVRRAIEQLRPQVRDGYSARRRARLDEALRAFQLTPDASHMAALTWAASNVRPAWLQASPELVRAFMATGVAPDDARARVELAAHLLEAGQPAVALVQGVALPDDLAGLSTVARTYRAAGRAADARPAEAKNGAL